MAARPPLFLHRGKLRDGGGHQPYVSRGTTAGGPKHTVPPAPRLPRDTLILPPDRVSALTLGAPTTTTIGGVSDDAGDRPRRRAITLVAASSGVIVAICAVVGLALTSGDDKRPTPPPSAPPSTAPSTPSAAAPPTPAADDPLVLAISVDGLNPDALTTLGRDGAPSFWRLIDDGASTLDARTSVELTITLPNHAGMLTGRPVSATSVTFNDDNGQTLASTHAAYVPGMFDVAHDHGLRTALFAEKDKFRFLVRSWDGRHGAPDTTGHDDGRDKLDVARIASADELAADVRDTVAAGDTPMVFWHVAAPDAAGHADGWLSASYLTAVRDADRRLGEVLAVLDADPRLRERTTVLLTADHGGPRDADQHGDETLLANHRVPFLAWGRGVEPGSDLYALDPTREDPQRRRPGYDGPQPVRNLDLAGTALDLLGLPAPDGATAPGVRLR
jgi:hypothetical protein